MLVFLKANNHIYFLFKTKCKKREHVEWKENLKSFTSDKPIMTKATARRAVVTQSQGDSQGSPREAVWCVQAFQSNLWPGC